MTPASLMITLAIMAGQLIKLPVGSGGGATLLDVVVIALSLFGLFQIKLRLIKPPTFIIASLSFILVALLSLMLTPLSLTTEEYLSSFLYIIRFSVYILLGWLLLSKALPSLKQNINQILLLSGGNLAVLGLFQFIFLPDLKFLSIFGWDPHYFRTTSTFLDPNFLGTFLVLTLILLYQRFLINKIWSLFMAVVIYLALLTTFSRGSYLAFIAAFLTLSILNRSFRLGLVTTLLFLGLMLGFSSYQILIAQPRNIDRAQSAESRLGTWQQGFKLFQSHPILGVGFNTYRYALREYGLGDQQFLKSRGSSTNDSSLLYIAATTGVVGFITYLFFLFALIKISLKGKILPAAIMGLLAQSFFANTLFYPPILLWIILMVI